MIAKTSGLMSVPDDLSSVDAAPLLCAGLTTFSALRNSPARQATSSPCSEWAGWGTSACNTLAAWDSRSSRSIAGGDRAELSKKLGAHHYIDSSVTDIAKALQALGRRDGGVGHRLGRQGGRGRPQRACDAAAS